MVNGTNLSGSAGLAVTAAVDKRFVINGGGLNVECTGSTIHVVNPEIKSPNTGSASSVALTGCQTTNENCTVPAEPRTVPVSAEVTLEGALATKVVIRPTAGTTIATVKFSGELCSVAGIKAVTGDMNVSWSSGQDERTSQLAEVNVTVAQNLLLIPSSAISMTGSGLLRLATERPWSFL
jgi:hypothetical protein